MAFKENLTFVIRANARKFRNELKKAGGAARNFNNRVKKFLKLPMVAPIAGLTAGFFALQAAMTQVIRTFGSAAQAARDAETAFAEINTLIDGPGGLTETTKKQIEQQSLLYGRSLQDNAKAYYDIVSSGFSDQKEALKII